MSDDSPAQERLPNRRLAMGWLALGGLGVGLAGTMANAWRLVRTQGEELVMSLEDAMANRMEIPGRRGSIFDCNGRELAVSEPVDSVYVDAAMLLKRARKNPTTMPELVRELARAVSRSVEELVGEIASRAEKRFVWVKRQMTAGQSQAVREVVERYRCGHEVGLRKESRRSYPQGSMAAHVVGFVNQDGAQEGLEKSWDAWLVGQDGWSFAACDSAGRPLGILESETRHPRPGRNLVLSVDLGIQSVVESVLDESCQKYSAPAATAIVLDVKTGEILALANRPTYDPNHPGDFGGEARKNRAITDPYEPGSTFKVFPAAAALEAGVTRLGDAIPCEGGVFGYMGRRLRDHHAYGTLSFEEVIAKSSNIGMAKLGLRLGPHRLYDALTRFGFGRATGVCLPGESRGLLYPPTRWSGTSILSVAMGQECAVTAMQLIQGFAALANGGRLMTPKLVRSIRHVTDQVDCEEMNLAEPSVVGRSCPEKVAQMMVESAMAKVVSKEGTGKLAILEDYELFGKTGTAQVSRPGGGYEPSLMTASFVAGGPVRHPRVAVLVAMFRLDKRNSGGAYYGGSVAAPVVKKIMEFVLPYLKVPAQPRAVPPEGSLSRVGFSRGRP